MNKILVAVAEDEPIILNNIIKKIKNAGPEYEIAFKANNGQEAINLLNNTSVDILVTDIEMPGINGIELIKHVRDHFPSIKIIVISGYSKFEYARNAMKYGVMDYLLKPICQEEMNQLLKKVSQTVNMATLQRKREILSCAVQGTSSSQNPPSNIENGRFHLALINLGNLPTLYTNYSYGESLIDFWNCIDFERFFSKCSGVEYAWIIDETNPLQKFIILSVKEKHSPARLILQNLFHFIKNVLGNTPFHIMINIGSIAYTEISGTAHHMRKDIPKCTALFTQSACIHPNERNLPLPVSDISLSNVNLIKHIQNCSALMSFIESTLMEYIKANYQQKSSELFLEFVFQQLPSLLHIEKALCAECLEDLFTQLFCVSNLEGLLEIISASLTQLFNRSAIAYDSKRLCLSLKAHLEQHYSEKLSLNSLADCYGYTASYLNRIFKKECGIPPMQYLMNIRIRHAKHLLSNGSHIDIKAIAAAIGYEDSRYFSRVFKNDTGYTPTEWSQLNTE